MFHPFDIVSFREIVSSVSTSGFLSEKSSKHCLLSADKKILQFKSLHEISVPDETSVESLKMVGLLIDTFKLLDTFSHKFLNSEDSCVTLHGLLHGSSDVMSCVRSVSVSESVESSESLLTSILGEILVGSTRLKVFLDGLGSSSTEDDDIKERVSTKSVSTVN